MDRSTPFKLFYRPSGPPRLLFSGVPRAPDHFFLFVFPCASTRPPAFEAPRVPAQQKSDDLFLLFTFFPASSIFSAVRPPPSFEGQPPTSLPFWYLSPFFQGPPPPPRVSPLLCLDRLLGEVAHVRDELPPMVVFPLGPGAFVEL